MKCYFNCEDIYTCRDSDIANSFFFFLNLQLFALVGSKKSVLLNVRVFNDMK